MREGTGMDSRVALITGAGSGIGRATALAFLRDGFRVALAGRNAQRLRQVAEESGAAERAFATTVDVTRPAEVRELFDAVKARFGRLDVLFNNAGVNAPLVPIEDIA